MSGFFERMAARALGTGEGAGPVLRARVPQPYELGAVPAAVAGRARRPPAGPQSAAPPGWPAWPDEGPDAPVGPPGSEAGGPPWSEPERWGPEQAADGGAGLAQPRQRGAPAGAAEGTRPSGPDLAGAGRGAAAPPSEAGRAPQPPRQARQAHPQGRRARRLPPSRPPTAGIASAPPAGVRPAEWDGPPRGGDRAAPAPAARGQDSPRRLRPPRPAGAAAAAPTSTPGADRARIRPAPEPARPPGRVEAAPAGLSSGQIPAVDVVALLRDHVVPALADRGDLDRGERPRIVAGRSGRPAPPAGTIAVAPGRVDVRGAPMPAGPGSAPARPEVHVRIDRVVVTRAPAAAAPPEPPPGAGADHAAYLTRRRERP